MTEQNDASTKEAIQSVIAKAKKANAGHKVEAVLASTKKMKRAQWLWQNWISLGSIALLAGLEDMGKSTWALHFAARVSHGQLEGEFQGKPANVGILATEDDWESIVLPRLTAAGADTSKIFEITNSVSLDRDATEIGKFLRERDIKLLILDPIITRMDKDRDSHNYRDVRAELEALGRVMQENNATVLGVTHFNKSTGPVENRIMGSRAWRAVVRQVIIVTDDPENENDRLLIHNKNNYGPRQPSIRFGFASELVDADLGISASKIVEKGTSSVTDIEAVAAMDKRHERQVETPRDRAVKWLSTWLEANQPSLPGNGDAKRGELRAVLVKEAAKIGIAKNTLMRAADELEVNRQQEGRNMRWSLEL